ncbi:MAG: hypothetical protein OES27_07250 [Nitrosopumilus sp.]|nr:hypothetical protein [Nitrosopumilus sp.]
MHKLALKLVFSNHKYIALSAAIFTAMFIPLSYIAEFLFFQPRFILFIPDYSAFGFSLVVIVCALTGLVLSMGIYRIQILKSSKKKMSSGVIGSIIGASAGACSCGSIGFAVISIFGAVGGAATAFLANYEIPLRLLSIGILVVTYFYMIRGLNTECKVNFSNVQE